MIDGLNTPRLCLARTRTIGNFRSKVYNHDGDVSVGVTMEKNGGWVVVERHARASNVVSAQNEDAWVNRFRVLEKGEGDVPASHVILGVY